MNASKPNLLIVASARARNDSSSSLLRLVRDNVIVLKQYRIHTTRGTGERLYGTGLFQSAEIELKKPGRDGGIAELAAMAARKDCEAAILLLDPSDPWSDAVENRALKRVLIQLRVRLMTTYAAAQRWLALEAAARAQGYRPDMNPSWMPANWVDGERNAVGTGGSSASDGRPTNPLEESVPSPREPLDLPVEKRTIALISHDRMKLEMVRFVKQYAPLLASHQRILTTGTTGWLLKLLLATPDMEVSLIRELTPATEERLIPIFQELLAEIDKEEQEKIKNTLVNDGSRLSRLKQRLGVTPNDAFVEKVMPLPSGPKGGDVLIAEAVLANKCHSIIFFHDPETAHPHNDDIRLLEHTSQLPGVFCECVSDSGSAEWWIRGLSLELESSHHGSASLAQKVRQRYKLHDLLLVDCADNEDRVDLGLKLAHACAGYFHQRLIHTTRTREDIRVGVGWGFGPSHVLSKLKEMKENGHLESLERLPSALLWSPLIGTLTPEITDREASTKAQDFCTFYGGTVDGFPCAAFARESRAVPDRAKELIKALETASLILTSASPWDDAARRDLETDTGVSPKYFPDNACGLMSGIVFDENGDEVEGDYAVVGLRLDGYRRAAERGAVILLCGGRRRNPVVRALLRKGVVSTLITTVETAEWLLRSDTAGEERPTLLQPLDEAAVAPAASPASLPV